MIAIGMIVTLSASGIWSSAVTLGVMLKDFLQTGTDYLKAWQSNKPEAKPAEKPASVVTATASDGDGKDARTKGD